jgi:hypothetical protein
MFAPGGRPIVCELFVLRRADTMLPAELDLRAEGHAHAGLPPGLVARAFSVADPEVSAQLELLRSRLPGPDHAWGARFDATEVLEALVLDLPDAPDLGHLQAAWAWARSWCRAG